MTPNITHFKQTLHKGGVFLFILYRRFLDDDCTYRAGALTYTLLLSLVPLMTVSFAILSAFPVFSTLSTEIQNFIFQHFIATSGKVVQDYLQTFIAQAKNSSALGSISLVITAVLMMFTLEETLNAIWRVKAHRKFFADFMLYWGILTLSPILIGLSIILGAYVTALPIVSGLIKGFGLLIPTLNILPIIFITITFTILYVAIPNCYVPLRNGLIGAIVATILFQIAKWLFTLYVSAFLSYYTLLYGALATIPFFLVWLYLVWAIILIGAIISNVLTTGYDYRYTTKIDGFTHAFRWLGYFWQASQQGESLSMHELIQKDKCNYQVEPQKQISYLIQARLIQPTLPGEYMLSRDLSQLNLNDLRVLLPWRLPTLTEIMRWHGPWEQQLAQMIKIYEADLKKDLYIPLTDIYTKEK